MHPQAVFCISYWASEICWKDLLALHMVLESFSGLLQSGFVPCLPQLPQYKTS